MPEAFAIKPEDPSSDDRWIIPGSDLRPPIKNSWALYMDPDRDDPMDLRTAAATIMKEWAGITSLDGRIFSGREHRAMDPREYYKLAIGAFKAGSLTSLFSEEWAEFHEAEGKGDKAGMRALANAKIKGEGVGAKVASAVDRNIHNTNASELGSMRKALGTVRDVMSPEDIDTLEHPYRLGLGYVQGVTGLYEKYHEAIEDERRVERYRKQLADENQWAVIESIKPHVSDNARKVLEMALQSADEPTNSAVMKEFEKLSTPEMRSIAGALQALHYDRDPDFKALCADAGRAFCNTLGMVTVGAVRGATDLVRRTWMDSAEYRDMVDRRVMLEDANRERMADWGIVGNAVIGAASTIPYMAAAAIPYVGMADMFFSARDEFQSQAARNGVDVSSLDFILGSSAFAIAYAYVEKIQWEKAFGGLANFSRRQMYCDVFHSVRAALGVAGAYAGTVLTESGEEGIQAALEEAATHWGLDQTLAGEAKAFTEDFVGSLGTMAIIGAFGGAKQGIAYRHGALAYDKADAMAAQSRILELDRHMAGHPGEVGPLAAYGRTYGRMVEDWIEAGTDVGRRQASLMRLGLTKEQAGAIHGALQSIWSAIEGSDASAERKAEQKSALIGGGHVLTPGEMIARIQNGDYREKVEHLADGSQAVDLSIAGKTLRMVVAPKRTGSAIDENDPAQFESVVNALNERNVLDADGAQFTVEGWTQLAPEERRTIIDQANLAVQGNVTFEDMDGNRLDGRVLDAITGRIQLTDEALPHSAFHETMHGVLRLLTDMARGEKDESGAWKVEPDSAAAALVGELGTLFKPRSEREAVDEERLSNAFQRYLTGRIGAVEHTGLFDRLGRFLARLFGYGGRTYEIENARTAQERLFNTAITGHIAQALRGAESSQAQTPTAATEGQDAQTTAEQQESPTVPGSGVVLGQLEADYPELAPLAALFRNRDPLSHEQMAQLVKATGERLTTDMVWAAGYRWNGVQERWEHDERLERPVDERDRPQQPFQGADGEIHDPNVEGPSSAEEGPSSEAEGTKPGEERKQVASRIPSPEFAMDGTIVDALPAHLREDGREIVAERGGTPTWMTDADGLPTELNERDWLRREAERRHGERRYSVGSAGDLSASLAPEAWGDLSRSATIVGDGTEPAPFVKGRSTKEAKAEIWPKAIENAKSQPNYSKELSTEDAPVLILDGSPFKITKAGLFHGSGRRLARNGNAMATIGEILNASIKIPNVQGIWTYRLAAVNFGRPELALVTSYREGKGETLSTVQILHSVNVKPNGVARGITTTSAIRPDTMTIGDLRTAWQDVFLPGLQMHLGEKRFSISGVYTGSAADYAQRDEQGNIVNGPSLLKIGTGEGAQVYGWGLYGSSERGVADGYARRASEQHPEGELRVDGKVVKGKLYEEVAGGPVATPKGAILEAAGWIQFGNGNFDGIVAFLEKRLSRNETDAGDETLPEDIRERAKRSATHVKTALELLRSGRVKVDRLRPRIYEQTWFTNRATPEETERHLLKWYEPVSEEQRGWILAQLEKEGRSAPYLKEAIAAAKTGQEVYELLAEELIEPDGFVQERTQHGTGAKLGPQAASEFLARAGIDGIKYPVDSYMKTTKDGDTAGWNYVSFRDDNIRVDHKWVDGEQRYQIAGRIGAERMGIRGLGDAEAMERSGATREDIWRETGWWRGKDGKWRVEIPDITLSMESINRDAYQNDPEFFVRKRKLADIIGETALFDAYPYLRNIRVQTPHSDSFGGLGTLGDYNGRTLIRLNMSAMKFDPEEVRATLAHEIQHAIQHQEQFAEGANVGYWQRQIDKGYDARTEGVKAEEARLQAQYERQKAKNPKLFADMEALWAIKPNTPRGKFNPDTLEPLEEDPPEWQRYDERRDALQEKYGGAIWDWMDLRSVLDSISNAHRQSAYELYHTTAGEVEARNVEKRLKMTPEERVATPPWKTADVDEGSQIVRFSVAPAGRQKQAGTAYPDAGAEIGGRRFSVQAFADGTRYVHVDTKQKDFDGKSPKEQRKAARRIIMENFQGRTIGIPPHDAYVDAHVKKEYVYPAKWLPGQTWEDKLRASPELGNLMLAGEYKGHEDDDGRHPEATGGWDKYETIFEVGGRFYTGTVSIMRTNHGRVFYALTKLQDSTQGNIAQHGEPRGESLSAMDTPPQSFPDGKPENGRGSVAGLDPGWWDVPGQADAAAREAREAARYGLSFGGPSFSHRSYVEAFAARDRALGFKRTDEDYKRLIDAFGLTGKMTVADAKSAGEALQAEMHGAAAALADLVKQAEKKNFRKTVDRMIMGAAGYGIEVGANARQAWAEYVARMRRLAKGRNAKNMAADAGLVFWELLLAAGPEGFEAQEKGKAGKAADTDDEAAALEAALIDGREGDLGYTAETAKARLAELLEAKKGDVAARNARLKARLAEWRRQEAARLAALQARQEAETARQAEAGEKDGAADGEGKGKGDKPQESEEEEAVAEMPDFRAFIRALQEDGWDLANPGEFAAVLRFYVEDWLAEKNGIAPGDVMKDPVAAAEYRTTVQEILRDSCNQLLDPNDGAAVRIAERMLGEIPGDASAAEIEGRSRSIIGFIKRNAIRQSRKKLVAAIIEDIKKLAIQGRMFDETEKDIGRKITGEREPYARYVARILMWGDKRIADEMARLNDIISGRLDAYRASRAEDAALEDLQRTDREIHRATERLAALQLWGGLRKKSPAEIALAGQQIHQWLETERNEHEKRWGEWKAGLDAKAEILAKAFSAGRADYTPDDPGFVGELADGLTTNFKMRLERMAVGSGTEGRQAIEEVMMLIYGGSERLGVLKAARRERTDAMLERCVEGTGVSVGDFLKSLGENIPEELNRQLATEDQPVRMTWGQALQLLGSLEQTASYAMNIEENGREGHRDLILAAVADKPQMLRLLDELRKIYEEDREAISQEFFAVTGNPILAPDPLYLPARMYTGARDNLETSVRAWNPFGPAFTPRIRNKRDFDLSASIMDVYNSRMKETATALAFGMRGMELRSILARKSVQEAIARTHGKYALRKMIAHLTDIVSDGYKGDGGQMEWYRRAIRALGDITTYSALSWNAVTMLKQMTSIPAWTALLDGGYGEIFHHITNFDAEAARELCRSPGFVARYGATGFGKMFRQELENPQGGNVVARLFKAGMTAVQMGDFVPGILVGTGVYKARKLALLRKGLAEPAAREQAARETWGLIEENQQSSRLENTPEILRRGGFIGRQLSKFATSPMMQVAHEIHTLRMWLAEARIEAKHGGKDSGAVKALMNAQGDDALRWRKRFVNQLICNHVLMPAAMYAIATLFKACLGGEPPDKEEIYGDLLMQMVAGPWSRIFLVGAIADQTGEWVARMAGGKPNVYPRGDLAATQHLHKALAQVGRIGGDVADMDWASVRDDFVKMAASYNAPFRYAATAVQNVAGYDPAKARRERKKKIRERKAAVGE